MFETEDLGSLGSLLLLAAECTGASMPDGVIATPDAGESD
jgi:hypothetical protein